MPCAHNDLKYQTTYHPLFFVVRDLGLRYFNTLNFSRNTDTQFAKARKMMGLIFRAFSTLKSKLLLFKTHVRPLLEYCSIMRSDIYDGYEIHNVQRTFAENLLGSSCSRSYIWRCESLQLDPLWLLRVKLKFSFLHSPAGS